MLTTSDQLYNKVMTFAVEIEPLLAQAVAERATNMDDLADKLFALRECEKRLNELRKHFSKEEQRIEKFFTIAFTASSHGDFVVRTKYVTAEPDVKMATRVPTRGDQCYNEFMKFLQIPDEIVEHGVLSVHFPGWQSYYTVLQSRGIELSDNIKSQCVEYTEAIVKTRKLKSMKVNVDE
jgi:hypothetical protein